MLNRSYYFELHFVSIYCTIVWFIKLNFLAVAADEGGQAIGDMLTVNHTLKKLLMSSNLLGEWHCKNIQFVVHVYSICSIYSWTFCVVSILQFFKDCILCYRLKFGGLINNDNNATVHGLSACQTVLNFNMSTLPYLQYSLSKF